MEARILIPFFIMNTPLEPRTEREILEDILHILQNSERRNRRNRLLSMIGSFIKYIPIFISIYFAVYFYMHSDEMLTNIIKQVTAATTNKISIDSETIKNLFTK